MNAESDRQARINRAFVNLADTLVADYDVIDMLVRLVGHCVNLLPAEAAAIMLADTRHQLRVVASTDDATDVMELLQLQSEQGPCLESFEQAAAISVPDLLAAEQRWPQLVAAIRRSGSSAVFRAVHAVPLRLRGNSIGVMNLFHSRPGLLPDADLALGQALADVATIAILQERALRTAEVLSTQLQTALASRVIIEQAKGVLAQHLELDMNNTFETLRDYSRDTNQRLGEVARAVVERRLDPDLIGPARR